MRHFTILFVLIFFGMINVSNAQGWVSQTSNTTSDLYSVCFVNENIGWAIGLGGYNIPKTTDGGTTWTILDVHASVGITCRAMHFADENTGWVAGDLGIYKTTDGGTTWTHPYTGYAALHSMSFINSTTGWVVGEGGTSLKTTDGGASWTSTTIGTSSDQWFSVYFVNENIGWAGGWYGAIDKTTDGGATWTNILFDFSGSYRSLYFLDNNIGWAAADGGKIKKTTNGGTSWTNQTTGTNADIQSIFFINSTTGWAVGGNPYITPHQVVLYTTDGGITWTSQSTPNTKCLYSVYFVNNSTGWAVGEAGTIFKTTTGGGATLVEQNESTTPQKFALLQNYPNPFNPTTAISYHLPAGQAGLSASSHVNLKVFDVLGRKVATLVNEVKPAGTFTVQWDASNFPSGIYFYQLTTGGFTQVKKMVLAK